MKQTTQLKTFEELDKELEDMYWRHEQEIQDLKEMQGCEVKAKELKLIEVKKAMHPELVKGVKVYNIHNEQGIFDRWSYNYRAIFPVAYRIKADGTKSKYLLHFHYGEVPTLTQTKK